MSDAAFPRPSSTVVLVRDGERAPELFMVRRPAKASFGDVFVFPGGVVDDDDRNVREACVGLTSAEANRLLLLQDGGLDYYTAAVRELFEETGVLLADTDASPEELQARRDALNAGALSWQNFVEQQNLKMRCDCLHYFSHWITPESMSKRYSTRFYVARLPEGQRAQHDEGELTDSAWVTAAEAITSDAVPLHFPTVKNLQNIAPHETVEALIDWADACAQSGVVAVSPKAPGGVQ